jgi:hypothetical protein
MTKRIESPVKNWPGYVLLHDPIPLVRIAEYEDVLRNLKRDELSNASIQALLLPVVIPCIAEWHLDNGFPECVTVDNFPGTPRAASSVLVATLVTAITEIYKGDADTVPNA